jgi:hypothetical protein
MDVRISPIGTDFFCFFCLGFEHEFQKKPVPIGEIGEIRTSIRITMYSKV